MVVRTQHYMVRCESQLRVRSVTSPRRRGRTLEDRKGPWVARASLTDGPHFGGGTPTFPIFSKGPLERQ